MSISLHDATVVTFIQTLGALEGILTRGLEYCRDNSIDAQDIVLTRLHPDMLPFRYQVISAVTHSIGAIESVRKGVFTPPSAPELNYEQLQKLVADAIAGLQQVSSAEVDGFADQDMKFVFHERTIPFTAGNFLLSFSVPNFFFHSTMTYAILRAKGVALGKRDFMGRMRIKR